MDGPIHCRIVGGLCSQLCGSSDGKDNMTKTELNNSAVHLWLVYHVIASTGKLYWATVMRVD